MNTLNRRSFLGLGLGAVSCSPFSLLAAARLDGKMAVPASPVNKKVTFTPLTIKIGAPKPFKVIHCSDSHLCFMSINDLIGGVDSDLEMYEYRLREMGSSIPSLAACVLKARREKLPLLHTGDLYDYESDANHYLAHDAFDGVETYLYTPGNHEYHGHWGPGITAKEAPVSRTKLEKDTGCPVTLCSKVINGVNFVGVDNGGLSYGLEKAQLAALKKEFAKGLPVVLMCHMPISTDKFYRELKNGEGAFAGERKWDEGTMPYLLWGLRNADKPTIAFLKEQKLLKAVLCGHLHREMVWPFTERVNQYVAGATYKGQAYEITFV